MGTADSLSSLGKAALNYARHGWAVFPVHGVRDGRCTCGNPDCPRPGKVPWTPHGFKDASTHEQTIRAWWTRWPDANIGFATGRYVVLDVDGPEGEAALAELEAKHEKLPATLAVRTGKGRHLYFAANGARVRNSAGKLGPHIDVRGYGGYVILPPSLHENGTRYEWINQG